jgi:hypothetical protein
MNTTDYIEKLDTGGIKWTKETFSPAEQLAIIALRPCLPFIGGRIMEMIDMAMEKTKENKG